MLGLLLQAQNAPDLRKAKSIEIVLSKEARHPVRALAFKPDSRYLAAGGDDGYVRIWEVGATQRPSVTTVPAVGKPGSVAYTPDGRLFTGWSRGSILLPPPRDWRYSVYTLDHYESVTGLAALPDNSRVYAVGYRGEIGYWDVRKDDWTKLANPSSHYLGLTITADGVLAAMPSYPFNLEVRELKPQAPRLELKHQGIPPTAAAFDPTGISRAGGKESYRLAVGHRDGEVGLIRINKAENGGWETIEYRELEVLGKHAGQVNGLAFAPDGQRFASASDDGTVRLWTGRKTNPPTVLRGPAEQWKAVAWSPDGKWVAAAGGDGGVRVWDVAAQKLGDTFFGIGPDDYLIQPASGHTVATYHARDKVAYVRVDGQVLRYDLLASISEEPPKPAQEPAPPAAPQITEFKIEPASVERGQGATVRWKVEGASSSVSIDQGIGAVQDHGSRRVFPSDSTTYTITAAGPGGSVTAKAALEVKVPAPPPQTVTPPQPITAIRTRLNNAIAYRRAENWQAAAEEYTQAEKEQAGGTARDPAIADEIRVGLALTHLSWGREQMKMAQAQLGRGNGAQALALYQDARSHFQVAQTRGGTQLPESSEADYGLASAMLKAGRAESAEPIFKSLGSYKDSTDRVQQAHALAVLATAQQAYRDGKDDRVQRAHDEFVKARDAIRSESVKKEIAGANAQMEELNRQSTGRTLLQQATEAAKRAQYSTAETLSRQSLRVLKPGDPDYEKAQQTIDSLPKPQVSDAITDKLVHAETAYLMRDFDTAERLFGEAIEMQKEAGLFSGATEARLQGVRRARQNARRGKVLRYTAGAVGLLALGLALFVWFSPAWHTLLYTTIGRTSRAIRYNERLLERRPSDLAALRRLVSLRTLTNARQALDPVVQRYLDSGVRDSDALLLAGDLAFERAAYDEASKAYHEAMALGYRTAEALERSVRLPPRPEFARLYETLAPDNDDAAVLLARLYRAEGREDPAAADVYLRALRRDSQDRDLRRAAARVCLTGRRLEEALELAGELLQGQPESLEALEILIEAASCSAKLRERAIEVIEGAGVPPLHWIYFFEELGAESPGARADAAVKYRALAQSLNSAAPERAIVEAHLAMDRGDFGTAAQALGETTDDAAGLLGTETRRGFQRYLKAAPQPEPRLVLREAYASENGSAGAVLRSLNQLMALPDLRLQARDAICAVVDRLPPKEITREFFSLAGWEVSAPDGALAVSAPADIDPRVYAAFRNARVLCYDRPVTVREAVNARDGLGGAANPAVFLVSPEKRQEVFAIAYATLAESRALLVPLDVPAMKEALAGGTCPQTLARVVGTWVGIGDVFDERNPVVEAAAFFGRGQFLHELTTKIVNGQNFGLYGLRKMGKTSLSFQLRRSVPRNILLAYVDFQRIATNSCAEVAYRAVHELRVDFQAKFPGSAAPELRLRSFDSRAPREGVFADFQHDLETLAARMRENGGGARMALIFDEVETVIPQGNYRGFSEVVPFFRLLRGMYQQESFPVTAVVGADPTLCARGTWGDAADPIANPVFQYFDEVFLRPLDRQETEQMVRGIGSLVGISWRADALDRLYRETSGHPFVTRQLCSQLLRRFRERPLEVRADHVEEGVTDFIYQRADYFHQVFEEQIAAGPRLLLEIMGRAGAAEMAAGGLTEAALGSGMRADAFNRAVAELERFSLLAREGDRFVMPMRLLLRWLRADWLGLAVGHAV